MGKKKNIFDQDAISRQLQNEASRLGGGRVEQQAYEGYKGWDPSKQFQDYAAAGLAGAKDQIGIQLGDLAGKAAGSGRLNTGYFDLDQGDVVRNVYADYGRGVQQAGLQTAGMLQQKNQDLLGYGQERRNTYLDLLSGNADRATAEAKANKKRGFLGTLGDIFKTGASVAGTFLKPGL